VRLRREGYRRALSAAGLAPIEGFELTGRWSEAWGREAVTTLFSGTEPPDALFCGNDQIGRGVLDALRERGVVVPDDVSVVGFDNWDVMVEAARPPLTSIDMNLRAMGEEAGERLLAMIAGEQASGVQRLPCTLVVRQSCGGR
jgi:LacI family transcriptional regulator